MYDALTNKSLHCMKGLGLWPIYVPCLLEQTLIMTLTVMKFVYDRNEVRNSLILKEVQTQHPTSASTSIIKASEEDVAVDDRNKSDINEDEDTKSSL